MKKCIFHIPWKLKSDRPSASQLRPLQMIEAFQANGYEVFTVMGNSSERKDSIEKILSAIKKSVKFDFCYSESSTGPTLIANGWKETIKAGNLDFKFFKKLSQAGIPIGLFYRDIYWQLDESLNRGLGNKIKKILYHYDLKQYNRRLNTLFLPSIRMGSFIPGISIPMDALPPGTMKNTPTIQSPSSTERIKILYIGGVLGEQYHMEELFQAVDSSPYVHLILCTRESDWKTYREIDNKEYKNITVVHKSGDELIQLFQQADIASVIAEPTPYFQFTMSYKVFEYLSYGIPIMATKNVATGDFVESQGIGWTMEYSTSAISDFFNSIHKNRDFSPFIDNLSSAKKTETWENRANQVSQILMGAK